MSDLPQKLTDHNALYKYYTYLLARREYSAYELQQKAVNKSYAESTIHDVLLVLQQKKYQSDERFCQNYLNYRSNQGFGKIRIRHELENKRIDAELIDQCIELVEWKEQAQKVLQKKMAQRALAKEKLIRFMLQRGFVYADFSDLLASIDSLS